jgi:tRNA pseudouridine55 synthase
MTKTHSENPRNNRSFEPRPKKRDVNGWLILDKPVGITSTHAVAVVKRLFNAKKAGHAGTLDPLASGLLPLALGDATKTVPFVMDGQKSYLFTVRWGIETETDDTEGQAVATSDKRPEESMIRALLPQFIGVVTQVPPRYSAIKIQGERAYDLARDGEIVEMKPREVMIERIDLIAHDGETSTFTASCGKGTYVRALARDFGRILGCYGHISALRRTRVGPFHEDQSVGPQRLEEEAASEDGLAALGKYLLKVQSALVGVAEIPVSQDGAARLMRGQSIILRGRDAPMEGPAQALCQGTLVAIGMVQNGEFSPTRVFTGRS